MNLNKHILVFLKAILIVSLVLSEFRNRSTLYFTSLIDYKIIKVKDDEEKDYDS